MFGRDIGGEDLGEYLDVIKEIWDNEWNDNDSLD